MILNKFLEIYYKFAYYDVQVALIEGRNYYLIYAFYETLAYIRSNRNEREKRQKIEKLEDAVNEFIFKINGYYDFIKKAEDKKIENRHSLKIINEVSNWLDEFTKAYINMQKYVNSKIIENLLIEFNNFLSHLLLNSLKEECKNTGASHLLRGSIDAYKEIILNEKLILLSKNELLKDFIKVREDEFLNVGCDLNIEILKKYKAIAETILTLRSFE